MILTLVACRRVILRSRSSSLVRMVKLLILRMSWLLSELVVKWSLNVHLCLVHLVLNPLGRRLLNLRDRLHRLLRSIVSTSLAAYVVARM